MFLCFVAYFYKIVRQKCDKILFIILNFIIIKTDLFAIIPLKQILIFLEFLNPFC